MNELAKLASAEAKVQQKFSAIMHFLALHGRPKWSQFLLQYSPFGKIERLVSALEKVREERDLLKANREKLKRKHKELLELAHAALNVPIQFFTPELLDLADEIDPDAGQEMRLAASRQTQAPPGPPGGGPAPAGQACGSCGWLFASLWRPTGSASAPVCWQCFLACEVAIGRVECLAPAAAPAPAAAAALAEAPVTEERQWRGRTETIEFIEELGEPLSSLEIFQDKILSKISEATGVPKELIQTAPNVSHCLEPVDMKDLPF